MNKKRGKGLFHRIIGGLSAIALAFSIIVSTAPAAFAWTANQWVAILSGAITYDSNLGGEMFAHELGYTKAAEYTYSERTHNSGKARRQNSFRDKQCSIYGKLNA